MVRVHLGLPQAIKACKNLKVFAARPRAFLEREQSVKGKNESRAEETESKKGEDESLPREISQAGNAERLSKPFSSKVT